MIKTKSEGILTTATSKQNWKDHSDPTIDLRHD